MTHIKKPAKTCDQCGKGIRGQAIHVVPPAFAIALGIDYPRTYHPDCAQLAGIEADA